jgi:hypothetical protein
MTQEYLPKEGVSYDKIRHKIKPFDLILFRGEDFVSDAIRILSYKKLKKAWSDDYSHAGIIITNQVLDHPALKDDTLYVWESTISGKLGQNIFNVDGESFLGTQLRNFDDLIIEYDKPNNTGIAWCQLNNNLYDTADTDDKKQLLKERFTELFNNYNGRRYDMNCISLLGALYPKFRCCRACIEDALGTHDWLFCSELCALVYKSLMLLPSTVDEKNVLPVDFINHVDEDKAIPKNFVKYPVKIVTKNHYDPTNFADTST